MMRKRKERDPSISLEVIVSTIMGSRRTRTVTMMRKRKETPRTRWRLRSSRRKRRKRSLETVKRFLRQRKRSLPQERRMRRKLLQKRRKRRKPPQPKKNPRRGKQVPSLRVLKRSLKTNVCKFYFNLCCKLFVTNLQNIQ